MTFVRLFVVVFILVSSFSSTFAAPKNNHWESITTKGKCLTQKRAVKTAIKEGLAVGLPKASKDLIASRKTAYRNCLKAYFFKALTKKVKALTFENLHIGYLSSGELMVVKKIDLLEDENFVNDLIASGQHLSNDKLKNAALMAKVYHHRASIDALKNKIHTMEMLKSVSK